MNLNQFIVNIQEEITNSLPNTQRSRYLRAHLDELIKYQLNNPDKEDIPNSLELYCNLNPNARECRTYEV
jgi:hypothetical protein